MRTNSGRGAPSAQQRRSKRNPSRKPLRSMPLRNCLGMMASGSTSGSNSGAATPATVLNGSIYVSNVRTSARRPAMAAAAPPSPGSSGASCRRLWRPSSSGWCSTRTVPRRKSIVVHGYAHQQPDWRHSSPQRGRCGADLRPRPARVQPLNPARPWRARRARRAAPGPPGPPRAGLRCGRWCTSR